jgi:5-methylcytosine-specific restriction endonuclease McrA
MFSIFSRHLSKNIRKRVWVRHNKDRFFGECYCCGINIDALSFEAAHVEAKSKGGPDTLDNLRPTCTPCNRDMKTQNLYNYMKQKYPHIYAEKKYIPE